MDFAELLSALATKVRNQREAIQTEEATKNAFIMPFISTILMTCSTLWKSFPSSLPTSA
jgi:hypothetical protein